MQNRIWVLALILCILVSCDSGSVFDEYVTVDERWKMNDKVEFRFQPPDTLKQYNMFINIRNNADYKYNNLFLIVSIEHPYGKVVKDTLEYRMADEEGRFLGRGFTDVKENKLAYNEPGQNLVFSESGEYLISVEHAMRANGQVEGIDELEGILEVGLRIEKPKTIN